jgi:hypothetical protein
MSYDRLVKMAPGISNHVIGMIPEGKMALNLTSDVPVTLYTRYTQT